MCDPPQATIQPAVCGPIDLVLNTGVNTGENDRVRERIRRTSYVRLHHGSILNVYRGADTFKHGQRVISGVQIFVFFCSSRCSVGALKLFEQSSLETWRALNLRMLLQMFLACMSVRPLELLDVGAPRLT